MDVVLSGAAAQPARILIVEDERIVAASLKLSLEQAGYVVPGSAGTGEQAVSMAMELQPDLILMDINLGSGMDGVDAVRRIHNNAPVPVIFLTAYADRVTLARAGDVAPFGFLVKPVELRSLGPAIEIALYRHRAGRERDALRSEVARLRTLLPVCAWCRKVKTEDGYWLELMDYVSTQLGASLSHGVCKECLGKLRMPPSIS